MKSDERQPGLRRICWNWSWEALRGSKTTSLAVLCKWGCMFLMKSHLNQIWFLSDEPTHRSAVYHDLPTVWHRDLCLLVWHQSLSPVCTIQTERKAHWSHLTVPGFFYEWQSNTPTSVWQAGVWPLHETIARIAFVNLKSHVNQSPSAQPPIISTFVKLC